jgi:hypothetical protein
MELCMKVKEVFRMRFVMFLSVYVFVLSACAMPVPQSREEFVSAVQKGPLTTKMEVLEIDRPFTAVIHDLESKSNECLNVRVTSTMIERYAVHRNSSTYRATLKPVADGKAEYTVQVQYSNVGGNLPEGGGYMMAADIEDIQALKTKVVTYEPRFGFGDASEAIKAWARGEERPCPRLH